MTWLHWLDGAARTRLQKNFKRTAVSAIENRHWGTEAPGKSPGGIPRLYVLDVRGLLLATGVMNYSLRDHGMRVLYRGQTEDWELRCSLLRGVKTKEEARQRLDWLDSAMAAIADCFDRTGTSDEREALAQHYGLPTRWLDLVDNVQTAAWFAYHEGDRSAERDAAVGYIHAVAYPVNTSEVAVAFDLRTKPSEWLRPHIQQAWSLRKAKPLVGLGRMSAFHLATFIVPRPLLGSWSAYGALTREVMFPNGNEDRGAHYWSLARKCIQAAGLADVSWYERGR